MILCNECGKKYNTIYDLHMEILDNHNIYFCDCVSIVLTDLELEKPLNNPEYVKILMNVRTE